MWIMWIHDFLVLWSALQHASTKKSTMALVKGDAVATFDPVAVAVAVADFDFLSTDATALAIVPDVVCLRTMLSR